MTDPILYTLDNGVRIIVDPVTYVGSAAVGLWCTTGSRHETDDEAGITHFIEHMLFKGTERRTAKQIADEIEGRGGMLNAFTDKEQTCYYCRVLAEDVGVGIDVLSDMVANSLLDPEELSREKGVVLEEIKRSEDEPSDHVHELHLGYRWGVHPLGKPVIGTPESVSSFDRDDLATYMDRRYRGSNLVLAVAGNVDPEGIRKLAEDALGAFHSGEPAPAMQRPSGNATENLVKKEVEQVHFCIGADGTSHYDDDLYTMAVLDNALGSGMGSRLFQEIRERRGLAYSVGSYTLTYTAGGAFTVYGGTGPKNFDQVRDLVRVEFDKVMANGLDDDEMRRTKKNMSGNMVLALEGMNARMMRMARNLIVHGRFIPLQETLGKIEAVTNDQLVELAKRTLTPDKVSTTAIGPF